MYRIAVLLWSAAVCFAAEPAQDELFKARALTDAGSFTAGIEGPNCDALGNIYAVNYARQGTIGKITPHGKGDVWVELPNKSVGNGIVFDHKGTMYVADYVNHNILAVDSRPRRSAFLPTKTR